MAITEPTIGKTFAELGAVFEQLNDNAVQLTLPFVAKTQQAVYQQLVSDALEKEVVLSLECQVTKSAQSKPLAGIEAVKNIKIDKITVWDSGNNADGNGSTANFVSGMMKTVPPLNDLFNMAGLNLPTYLKGNDSKTNEIENTAKDSDTTAE